MAARLDDIRKLMAQGYELEGLESDKGQLQVSFRRGSRRVMFLFYASDAREILLAGPLRLEAL